MEEQMMNTKELQARARELIDKYEEEYNVDLDSAMPYSNTGARYCDIILAAFDATFPNKTAGTYRYGEEYSETKHTGDVRPMLQFNKLGVLMTAYDIYTDYYKHNIWSSYDSYVGRIMENLYELEWGMNWAKRYFESQGIAAKALPFCPFPVKYISSMLQYDFNEPPIDFSLYKFTVDFSYAGEQWGGLNTNDGHIRISLQNLLNNSHYGIFVIAHEIAHSNGKYNTFKRNNSILIWKRRPLLTYRDDKGNKHYAYAPDAYDQNNGTNTLSHYKNAFNYGNVPKNERDMFYDGQLVPVGKHDAELNEIYSNLTGIRCVLAYYNINDGTRDVTESDINTLRGEMAKRGGAEVLYNLINQYKKGVGHLIKLMNTLDKRAKRQPGPVQPRQTPIGYEFMNSNNLGSQVSESIEKMKSLYDRIIDEGKRIDYLKEK